MAFHPNHVDLEWLAAWLEARSIARGFPAPILDRGGWRIETGSAAELRRWVFPAATPELRDLADSIDDPRMIIRAAVRPEALQAALGPRWQVADPTYTMQRGARLSISATIGPEYRIEMRRDGSVAHVFVLAPNGDLAASGHAGRGERAMAYDRIATDAAHRRRGLGRVVMRTLADLLSSPDMPELLVATEAGRALYETMGWRVVGPYAQATLIVT